MKVVLVVIMTPATADVSSGPSSSISEFGLGGQQRRTARSPCLGEWPDDDGFQQIAASPISR